MNFLKTKDWTGKPDYRTADGKFRLARFWDRGLGPWTLCRVLERVEPKRWNEYGVDDEGNETPGFWTTEKRFEDFEKLKEFGDSPAPPTKLASEFLANLVGV